MLCALALVELACSGRHDVAVLAPRGTDPAPALDAAARTSSTRAEAARWLNLADRRTRGDVRAQTKAGGHLNDQGRFTASLDPRAYP